MSQGRNEHSRYFVTASMPTLLREVAAAAPPRVLADLGAGEGAILYALERAGLVGERAYAVDLSAESVRLAEGLSPKVVGIVSDVAHVDAIADGSVDAVTSSQVIEHLPDDRVLATEIARILRPDGWFYVSSVVRGSRAWWFRRGVLGWQIDPTHVREYSSDQDFAAALEHPRLELDRVQSRPLRFPIADPLLRLAGTDVTVYERRALLKRLRESAQLRVPGYSWVEASGRKRS